MLSRQHFLEGQLLFISLMAFSYSWHRSILLINAMVIGHPCALLSGTSVFSNPSAFMSGTSVFSNPSAFLCILLTLLHSERPKLYTILAFLSAIGLNEF